MQPTPVRIEAGIERPPPLAWVGDLPCHERVDWWPGSLLSWRWLDRELGTCTGLVRYQREGLLYEHWVHGDLILREPGTTSDETAPPLPAQTALRS